MYSYKRLICLLLSLILTILFAGIAECFCTPYDGWFLGLSIPKSFVSHDFHNSAWLVIYILFALGISKDIVQKNKLALCLWGGVFLLSILGVASLFYLKNLIVLVVIMIITDLTLLSLSLYNKNNSIVIALITAWYIYLSGVAVVLAM